MAQGQNMKVVQPVQMQNSVAGSGIGNITNGIAHEGIGLRQVMQNRIYVLLQQRQPTTDAASKAKLFEYAKRFENGLLRMAKTKEEYLDYRTLKGRLDYILRQHCSQRRANSLRSVDMMVQTTGVSHGGSQSFITTSAADASMSPAYSYNNLQGATIKSRSILPTSRTQEGPLFDGCQQLTDGYPLDSSGSMPPPERMIGQMIPTPGFNTNCAKSHLQNHTNEETCADGSKRSAESGVGAPLQLQNQYPAGSNVCMPLNLCHKADSGFSTILYGRSSGMTNSPLNTGLGIHRNNAQLSIEPRTSEGFLSSMHLPKLAKPLHQPVDELQASMMHRYAMNNSDPVGSENFYGVVTSSEPMADIRDMSSLSPDPTPRVDASFPSSRLNPQTFQQVPLLKSESLGQFENMSFQSSFASEGNLALVHQQPVGQQSQHQARRFELQGQCPQQPHHGQYMLKQDLLNKDVYLQYQLVSGSVTQVEQGPGLECHNKAIQLVAMDERQPSKLQNQYQVNTVEGQCIGAQCSSVYTSQLNTSPSLQPHFGQMQRKVHSQDLNNLSVGVQPSSQGLTRISENSKRERAYVGTNSCQRIPRQHGALCDGSSAEAPMDCQNNAAKNAVATSHLLKANGTSSKSVTKDHSPNYANQRRWLLFLWHARACHAPEDKCKSKYCSDVKKLLKHVDCCKVPACNYRYCLQTRELIHHHKNCRSEGCPVCVFVKSYKEKRKSEFALQKSESYLPNSTCGYTSYKSLQASCERGSEAPSGADDQQPSVKRLKVEQPPQLASLESESTLVSVSAVITEAHSSMDWQGKDYQQNDICKTIRSDARPMDIVVADDSVKVDLFIHEQEKREDTPLEECDGKAALSHEIVCLSKQESFECTNEMGALKEEIVERCMASGAGSKSGKSKIKVVSLIELFTPEQVKEHILGLRQWVGQGKTKAEKNKAIGRTMTESSCQLCAVEKLAFEPTPIYCTPCGARIKRNSTRYTLVAGESRNFVCTACYNEVRGTTIAVDGTPIPKAKFEKNKITEEVEEGWVQCDKCEAWQHQICALFNGRRNHGNTEYTCPNCYIKEVEQGERKPLPQSVVLGAKDLPTTFLSNHIEKRLFRKLKQERQERARLQEKSYEEVPGAESLVVRVVSSVDKVLEVMPQFLDLFREENYSSEFPYKSKAILLFQKIEGVEVCLFGMYVQEFGTESAFPNQRRVYLSYLDSVKYFRPEAKTVSGEALRTFVYHEILIGYLEYCKKRGFTSCYIWACPPLKGEDYILYCHPEIQKTPKTDKLREWYLAMLKKASKEKVVVERTNLYDHFFVQSGECRAKVTAARLPYFDGDYWPGAAEDLIHQMGQEEDDKKLNRRGVTKKIISKRALKAAGQLDLSVNASKDLLLMHKLGEIIGPIKEDFIMVHLQHCCKHCCLLMVSGNRWVCNQCKNFQLCDKCFELEQNRAEKEKHPVNQKEKHALYPVAITDVPTEIKEEDDILESEFFDTRQAFLSLCQGNHYQYDTLRRAKHSSMMVLYHLHNPTAPAFATACTVCQQDIEIGQGWRCNVCSDYEVCNACFSKGVDHPHKLINRPTVVDTGVQNTKANQRVQQLRELLLHASGCRTPQCGYPECRQVKILFRHGRICQKRSSGGCSLCKLIWGLLRLHARSCRESQCRVPRCGDLRALYSRQQQQSDSRRRAAVMEMMQQRSEDAPSTSD
ncbi:PREDICTED: histone acetyltransferase HAC5 isoform X1 [Tarenaya hassleriana]|uniref:histone acetyltransferase HAC5 isoform X2 n=1 Tax=Tarenaya hassleriana TaxID=28532 RepID=UPI00053C759D|nr:PREDICTED: histone acetyltransferase HAC5 isoform X2 [Tarenaya hassleriana]XP_010534780.1 PREDICTED: histone acetyltransferase HAC5 isoform X1 [Tarenaya hassleriana]